MQSRRLRSSSLGAHRPSLKASDAAVVSARLTAGLSRRRSHIFPLTRRSGWSHIGRVLRFTTGRYTPRVVSIPRRTVARLAGLRVHRCCIREAGGSGREMFSFWTQQPYVAGATSDTMSRHAVSAAERLSACSVVPLSPTYLPLHTRTAPHAEETNKQKGAGRSIVVHRPACMIAHGRFLGTLMEVSGRLRPHIA